MNLCTINEKALPPSHSEDSEGKNAQKLKRTHVALMESSEEDQKRLWSRVRIGGLDECWEYLGKTRKGYGRISINNRDVFVHRAAYYFTRRQLDSDVLICHACDNRKCVNPIHLFSGSALDNNLDCISKKRRASQIRTECNHGHEFTPETTYIDYKGHRRCLVCIKIQKIRFMEKRKQYINNDPIE